MLQLADHLPIGGNVDAIYVTGLSLTLNKVKLTELNRICMEEAVRQMRQGAKHLIFSACYSGKVLERELFFRREIVKNGGIDKHSIREIVGIVSTEDELSQLALVLNEVKAKSVLLISDRYHMPRLVRWARLRLLPDVEIFNLIIPRQLAARLPCGYS